MNEFIQMVFSLLGTAILRAVVIGLPVLGGTIYFHRRRHGKDTPLPWKRMILILLLVGYLAILEFATLSRLGGTGGSGFNFRLFLAWREAWLNYSIKNWANVLLNIALFIPLGVLIPLVFPKCGEGLRMLAVALGTTLLVETLQWLRGSGIVDVDDIFANCLGAMMGWCCLRAVVSGVKRKWGAGLGFLLLAMIPVAAVGGIFLAYELQPYGNLTQDYLYRIDTDDVNWILECELPEQPDTAAVYRANAMTVEECDAYALEFAKHWGGEYDDIFYYDKEIHFRDYDTDGWTHYLTVFHLDGSYEYWGDYHDFDYDKGVWAQMDRTQAEQFLRRYDMVIPAEAVFSVEVDEYDPNGVYRHGFQAAEIVTDAGLVDGAVYFSTSVDGSYIDIDNHLITYAYYADEPILTAAEACQRMRDGWFDGGWFEKNIPEAVSILSCTLGYEIDTKGYYQPVYYFEVMSPDWDDADTIMIPAMK